MIPLPVLYVNDLQYWLDFRKRALEAIGFQVRTAPESHSAMEMIRGTTIAALVLEYKHDGLNAKAVACTIKRRYPQISIILISAHVDMPHRLLWLAGYLVMRSRLPPALISALNATLRPPSQERMQLGTQLPVESRTMLHLPSRSTSYDSRSESATLFPRGLSIPCVTSKQPGVARQIAPHLVSRMRSPVP